MPSLSLARGWQPSHTSGVPPRHGWWLQHPWLMPRPSHWRFNNCYKPTTHRQKAPTYNLASADVQSRTMGAQVLCLARYQ